MNYRKQDVERIVEGLNKLCLAVQKMMQGNGEPVPPPIRVRAVEAIDKVELASRIIQGVWLLSAKKTMPHGEFQAFRRAKGLTPRTSEHIMKSAKRFLQENATPVPEISTFSAWSKREDIRAAVRVFAKNNTWRQLRSGK